MHTFRATPRLGIRAERDVWIVPLIRCQAAYGNVNLKWPRRDGLSWPRRHRAGRASVSAAIRYGGPIRSAGARVLPVAADRPRSRCASLVLGPDRCLGGRDERG